jgi:ElaB/YqjD/DUF883 family membrane-anchored ribosome-binding protein
MSDHAQYDDLVRNLREMSEHLAKDASDVASRSASTLAHSAAEFLEKAKKDTTTAAKKVGEEVKEHPLATSAIVAAALGLIGFALAVSRRNGH